MVWTLVGKNSGNSTVTTAVSKVGYILLLGLQVEVIPGIRYGIIPAKVMTAFACSLSRDRCLSIPPSPETAEEAEVEGMAGEEVLALTLLALSCL